MSYPPKPLTPRPTEPFNGKVVVEIVFDVADPNGDSRVWYWPEQIAQDIKDRIEERKDSILIQNEHGGIMHESWVKDALIRVRAYKRSFWNNLLGWFMGY